METKISEPATSAVESRALAYLLLLTRLTTEVSPQVLGERVEAWAIYVSAVPEITQDAAFHTLKHIARDVPWVSLARACDTLGIDPGEVFANAS